MALFAKSERFPAESCATDLGPGDYNPPTPKPNSAGAVSLGFTGPKGLPNSVREQAVEEDTNLSPRTSAARLRRTSAATSVTRRPSMGGPRSSIYATATRVGKLEVEQLAKQLTRSEREREKLQNEVLKFRQREAALIRSEKRACAESAMATSERELLTKQVEAAEHRASIAEADAERLKSAEAEAEQLKLDIENVRKIADEAAATSSCLQTENDSLSSRVLGLEERVKGFLEKEAELKTALSAAERREKELERRRVKEVGEIKASLEEELKEARASVNRSIAIAEEASRRAETIGAELTATKFGARPLEALTSRLWSDLEACKGSLNASEDEKKALVERMDMLHAEWEERMRMLETGPEVSKSAPEENDVTIVEIDTRAIGSDQDGMRARLERGEVEASAVMAEKSRLEKELAGEKTIRGKLELEVASAREALRDAARRGASLEVNLAERESEIWRLKREMDESRSRLASSDELRKRLEAMISAKADSITELQQRLGDALAEGVQYADQAIISEERLRGSEAEYTALWKEREEAREQLRVALAEGRELASKAEKSAAETVQLREALQKAEFRLTSAVGDAEELEEELAASRDQCAISKKELEKVMDKHADACSEARLLTASCEESRAEIARLREELGRTESGRGQADAKREGFWANLALNKKQKDSTKKEMTEKDEQVHGYRGAGNDAVLEARLREAELSAERLRSALESTEMTMSEVQADAQRSRFDMEDALRKCTDFQERLSEADDRLRSEAADRQYAEEALSRSASRVAELEQALREAEFQSNSAAAAREELDARLKETIGENGHLRDTLAKALVERNSTADRIARLEVDVEECSSLRKTGVAVVERAVRSAATLKSLEARVDELTSEAEMLRRAVVSKDAELEEARARLEETAGRLENTTGRLEEMTGRLQETTARLRAANAFAEEQKSKTVEYELEGARLMELLEDIEADFAEGKETTEDLKQDLADVRGMGMNLAERLASLVAEKNEIEKRFHVAEAARGHLERELEIRETAKEGLAGEAKGLRKECERLKVARQSQAEGAQVLLAESEAQYQETIARHQLAEIKSAQEIAIAKKEVQRAKDEVETVHAELGEVRARNDSLSRTLREELSKKNVHEAGLANQKDTKNENARLLHDTAALSAELALATAVLEVVGILPKEDAAATTESASAASAHAASRQDDESDSPEVTGIGRGLFARALSGVNSRNSSRENDGSSGIGAKQSKTATSAANSGTTTESLKACVPLRERLLRAIDSTEPSRRKGARKPPQRQLSGASAGCFPSISCGAADFYEGISAAKPSSPSPELCYLADDRVRDEVRRVLQTQGARGVGE